MRVVCKRVLIDAFSPFDSIMAKHFSLNCHSQICAHVFVEQEREKKMWAGHYNTAWKEKSEVVKGRRERGRGAEEQTITTIREPFKKPPFSTVWYGNQTMGFVQEAIQEYTSSYSASYPLFVYTLFAIDFWDSPMSCYFCFSLRINLRKWCCLRPSVSVQGAVGEISLTIH